MTSNEWIVAKIKMLCSNHNISINQLAHKANITQSTLNSILQGENKNPKILTLAKIAHAFDITLSQFLAGIEDDSNILVKEEKLLKISQATALRIKKICEDNDITLNKLCTLAGITQSTANNIIHGSSKNPGIVTIKKLCDAVDITIQEFFDDELFYNLEQEIE